MCTLTQLFETNNNNNNNMQYSSSYAKKYIVSKNKMTMISILSTYASSLLYNNNKMFKCYLFKTEYFLKIKQTQQIIIILPIAL